MKKRIGLIGENSIEFIEILLRIWQEGDCAVLIDWRIPPHKAIMMMNEAKTDVCYIEENKSSEYYKQSKNYPINIRRYIKKSRIHQTLPSRYYSKIKWNYSTDEAIILFSSGTTGKNKGIILSHKAIQTNASSIAEYMELTEKDTIFITKSLVHSSTLVGELLAGIKANAKILVGPTFITPRVALQNIQDKDVTIVCLNPTLLQMYIDEIEYQHYKLNKLRTIYVSGSKLSFNLKKAAERVLGETMLFNVYGMTEAGPRICAQTKKYHTGNSVGRAIKDVQIMITDNAGRLAPIGKVGNIYVHTPSSFDGYISHDYAISKNGWLNTKDLGYIDQRGELYIVGRSDDMILRDSHNIFPDEIEEVILTYPEIKQCVVFEYINPMQKQAIICYYCADQIIKGLRSYCLQYLPVYEIPNEFYQISQIPTNINGKISRRLMVKYHQQIVKRGTEIENE